MKKFFTLLVMMITVLATANARTFQHPGITYTKADILRMKAEIAAQAEPYYSTYEALVSNGYVSRAASTSMITSITSDDDYNNKLGLPGRCALDNALLYQLTGETAYATKAIAWLNDLSYITTLEGETMALSAGKVELLIEAAELMRDYTGWASADKARFDAMLKNVFYPQLKNFDRARWGNQGLTAARAIIAMGVYLDDEGTYDHAYNYLTAKSRSAADTDSYPIGAPTQKSRQSTSAYMYTYDTPTTYGTQEYFYDEALPYYIYDNGQCEESCRDQGHAQYGLNIYGNIAEIAWNQGDNLYGELSNRILLGFEWTYRYNLETSWAVAKSVTSGATFTNNQFYKKMTRSKRWYSLRPYDGDRGADYSCGLNREMVLAHYAVRAERPATEYTYLQQSVDNLIRKYGYEQGDVKAGGHYYEFPGWGSLTKHRQTWMVGDPVVSGEYAMHTTGEIVNFTDVDRYNAGNDGHTMKYTTVNVSNISFNQTGGYASYTVNVPTTKTYALKVAYTATADEKIGVAFDGGSYNSLTLTSGATEATMNITLTKGIHVFRFKANAETPAATLSTFSLTELEPVAGAPKMEKLYRTNGTNDAWTTLKVNDVTKTLNGVDAESHAGNFFEVKYNAGLFAIQKYEVADLDKASKLTVKLYRNESNSGKFGTMGLWSMANETWQTSSTFSDVYPYVKAVIGVDAHQTTGDYTAPLAQGVSGSDTYGTYQEFTISDDALNTVMQNAIKNADGNYEICFIVTSANPLSTSNFIYNNSQVANENAVPTCVATTYNPAYPVAEYNYRPKADGSGWDSSSWPKVGTSASEFECRYGSRILVVQQYKLLNYNKNKEYTITLHQSGNAGELAVWDYAAALPTSASECYTQCAKVTGVTPGSTDGTNAIDPITSSTCTGNAWTFVFAGAQLTPVSIDANGTATVNLLITTKNLTNSSTTNAKFYTYNNSNDESNYPTISESLHVASRHPVKEYGYRPKTSGTGYDALNVGTTATSIEANYAARLFIIQQYEIPNYSAKQNITLTLTNSANGTELGVWDYPYNSEADMPSSTSTSNETLIANLANVTGYTPWNTSGTKIEPITTAAKSGSTYSLTIPASKLTPVAYNSFGDAIVNILITNTDMTNSSAKAKVYSYNTANTEAQWPTIAVGTFPVYNNTTGTGYTDLASAVAAAETEDEIEISADQTISARLDIATDMTIKGATGTEKLVRDASKDIITVLAKANVTLENIILDGQNVDRARTAIESSTSGKIITLKNVTIQNYSNTTAASGIIQLKNNGKMVADGVTMNNCNVKDGYGYIFVGSNNALTLKGDNGTCGSIYNEKSYTMDCSEASHTTPIIIRVGTVTEGNTIIKGSNDQSLYTLVNDDYKWMTVGSNLQIASPSVTLTIGDAGCATIVLPFDAELPYDEETQEGVKAYNLTTNGTVIYKEEVTKITANKPVYLEGTKDSYTFTASGTMVQEDSPVNGALTGVYAETFATPGTYVLQRLSGNACFYEVEAGEEPTIGKYRAYLTASSGAKVLYFDDTTTGISEVQSAECRVQSAATYNLAGQRVNANAKGFVISNGKKYLNK